MSVRFQSSLQQKVPNMVSYSEIADRPRRSGSVAGSRTLHSRSHHNRNRSHAGGSSYAPQNEFPFFAATGDVEIVIAGNGQEKRYLLHRLILAQCSGFFEAAMSEEWSRNPALPSVPQQSAPELALSRIGEESVVGPLSPAAAPISVDAVTRGPSPKRRWRFELDREISGTDDEPFLKQVPPTPGGLFSSSSANTFQPAPQPSRARPPPPSSRSTSFFHSMANLTLSAQQPQPREPEQADPIYTDATIRDYDNLFRTFYNYSPTLNSTNIANAYSECKALLAVADMYDALPVVGSRIDHHLLRFGSRLFKQIAKYPPSYLKLGFLARSRIIFSEAMVHVIGKWPQDQPYLRGQGHGYEVPQSVIELIEDKVDELEETKAKVEAKLFRLTLTTSRGERVTPTNDYLGWLAMSLFRQWLAENTTPPPQPILKNSAASRANVAANIGPALSSAMSASGHAYRPPATAVGRIHPVQPPVSTGRIYRLLGGTNSQAFLAHDELKRFLKLSPDSGAGMYTRDNLRRFERKMEEVKNIARDIVKPMTRNCLELDLRHEPHLLSYLTCSKVEDHEIPWD